MPSAPPLADWLSRVDGEVARRLARASQRTDSVLRTFATLHEVATGADRVLDVREERREKFVATTIDVPSIVARIEAGRVDLLRPAETRFVIRHALTEARFTLHAIVRVLTARPALWSLFVRQLFQHFDQVLPVIEGRGGALAGLTCNAPVELRPVVAHDLPLSTVLSTTGLIQVAQRLSGTSFREAQEALVAGGIRRTTSYGQLALAAWFRVRAKGGRSLDALVHELCETRDTTGSIGARLLPSAVNSHVKTAPGERPCELAQVRLAATVLESRFPPPHPPPPRAPIVGDRAFAEIETHYLASQFGDPRTVTVNDNWDRVRKLVDGAYQRFVESLIRDDIRFFFEHAFADKTDREQSRAPFWLEYVGSIERTLCLLDRESYRRVDRALKASDPRIASALGRARRFDEDEVSAFCLIFREHVVIEFSKSGNAAYMYRREDFDRRILPQIERGTAARVADLKLAIRVERLLHQGEWRDRLHAQLRKQGLRTDPARH